MNRAKAKNDENEIIRKEGVNQRKDFCERIKKKKNKKEPVMQSSFGTSKPQGYFFFSIIYYNMKITLRGFNWNFKKK